MHMPARACRCVERPSTIPRRKVDTTSRLSPMRSTTTRPKASRGLVPTLPSLRTRVDKDCEHTGSHERDLATSAAALCHGPLTLAPTRSKHNARRARKLTDGVGHSP